VPKLSRSLRLALAVSLFALVPVHADAQGVAPPRPSVLRMAVAVDSVPSDSVRHTGWTQSNGAAVGGMVGVVAGLLGVFALRNDVYSSSDLYLKGAVLFGALGVVLGSLAGAEAEGKQ
jgi:hypothetical protein